MRTPPLVRTVPRSRGIPLYTLHIRLHVRSLVYMLLYLDHSMFYGGRSVINGIYIAIGREGHATDQMLTANSQVETSPFNGS